MKSTERHLDATRRAILDALAHVIVESTGFGFSVQDVATRAGVTHRTVYNQFPTRGPVWLRKQGGRNGRV